MPAWIIRLGLPLVLAYALWKRYGQKVPGLLSLDPNTGQALSFDSSQPNIFTQAYDYVMNLYPSQAALDFIRQTEALSLTPYHGAADAPGVYTIGYGHRIQAGEPYWPSGSIESISNDEAEQLFEADVNNAADAVRRNVTVPLSQGQFDSLTSFFFNLGEHKIMTVNNGQPATLIQKLNAGDYGGAAAEFQKWVYSNGQIQGGLVTRRVAEAATFSGVG